MSCVQGQFTSGVRPNAKGNAHITLFGSSLRARTATSELHRVMPLRESRKITNIHTTSGFIWGIPVKVLF
jgi:hypothetical protein